VITWESMMRLMINFKMRTTILICPNLIWMIETTLDNNGACHNRTKNTSHYMVIQLEIKNHKHHFMVMANNKTSTTMEGTIINQTKINLILCRCNILNHSNNLHKFIFQMFKTFSKIFTLQWTQTRPQRWKMIL
jgi:hypothetical protein